MTSQLPAANSNVQPFSLDDRYLRTDGSIYVSGIQALVRALLDRVRYDRNRSSTTGVYVTGYEGSPLAGYDLELARRSSLIAEHGIVHQPAVNEELAATAVAGTQIARTVGTLTCDGIVGVWYGKAPGLDRATDALRHANLMGTSPQGGAVALVGDDPGAKSSSVPCSSELALADLDIPTFYPGDPAEVVQFARHAVELSRASGVWSAIKVATAVADGSSTATVSSTWLPPDLGDLPRGLRAYRHRPHSQLLGGPLAELERTLHETRLPIATEYIRRSGLNVVMGGATARIGIIAAGKTYLDLRHALQMLGLNDDELALRGIRLLKLGVVYPLEATVVHEFAAGLDEIIVVEDKRPFLENAVKAVLYGTPNAPVISGKRSPDGGTMFRTAGELEPDGVAEGLAARLADHGDFPTLREWSHRRPRERTTLTLAPRTPYFCSGCPHNSSAKVPDGTVVGGGIGCHAMVLFMPETQVGTVAGLTQMGGEGAQWIGMAPFLREQHFVQNMGDGTFSHSGSLAIRAAVAAGVNVTYKLLFNSAVAMTGGQAAVGGPDLAQLVALLKAERVSKIVVTSDRPRRSRRLVGGTAEVRHRDEIVQVQQELAACPGVTVLIHDQECAAEKRRKRRRGTMETPTTRIMINERVCEGCGDCGAKSNCLSVHPVATEFGRKTRIDQSSCNYDYSCVKGDCPSFIAVTPGNRPAKRATVSTGAAELPLPTRRFEGDRFSMRITGVGGTGITTAAQILAVAAVLDGRHVRTLDQTGLAQKGGAVVSDLRFSADPFLAAAKLSYGECDLYLGADSLVATDPANSSTCDPDRTVAVVSTSELPTGRMVVDTSATFPAQDAVRSAVELVSRTGVYLDARAIAEATLGDDQYATMILVGAAYQAGTIPLDFASLETAIELNATEVEKNRAAIAVGRRAYLDLHIGPPTAANAAASPASTFARRVSTGALSQAQEDLRSLVVARSEELVAYQNLSYAERYLRVVEGVYAEETKHVRGRSELSTAVALNLFKLMAYKDEYEVARLSLSLDIRRQIEEEFGAGSSFSYRLHPPVLRALGMKRKISLGPWFDVVFRTLHAARRLRGGPLDPFGYAHVRRVERGLIDEYCDTMATAGDLVTPETYDDLVALAELPDMIRGYEQIKLDNVERYEGMRAELLLRVASTTAPPVSA